MKQIPTTDERLANNVVFNQTSGNGREVIKAQHLTAELLETREQLRERLIQPSRACEYDLDILKQLKREFVEKMLSAGVQYDTAGKISYMMNVMLSDFKDAIDGQNAKL